MFRAGFSVLLILSFAGTFIVMPSGLAASKVDIQGEVLAGRPRIDKPPLVRLLKGTVTVQEMPADSNGRFRFKNVDRGSYTIHVECDGYYGQDVPVVASDTTPRVSITLQAAPGETPTSSAFDPFREFDLPPRARKEFDLGRREQKTGQCARAMPHFQKAVAMYPRYSEAFSEIGRCNVQMGNLAAAEESFKKAVQFGSGIGPTVDLANLYVTQQRFDEGEKLITRLLPQNPAEGDLYAVLARIYFARGRTRDAELAGLEAHSRGHQSPDIHLILAKIYENQRNRPALITQLRTYLDENPLGTIPDQVRKQLQDVQSSQ
jgi:tetratricopeptide (TPR) repeat protein